MNNAGRKAEKLLKVLEEAAESQEGFVIRPNSEVSNFIKDRPTFLQKN
jgi:hypothetical protein